MIPTSGRTTASGKTAAVELWRAKAQSLGAQHTAISDASRDQLRHALIQLNSLFLDAPKEISTAYRSISERRLEASKQRRADSILAGKLGWDLPTSDPALIAEILGSQIRAADWVLARISSQWPSETSEWLVEDLGCYVIPRTQLGKFRTAAAGQNYRRRGLVNHRIIPTEVYGFAIDVKKDNTKRRNPVGKAPWKFGACLFENVSMKPTFSESDGDKAFIVNDLTCQSAPGSISDQIEGALAENCFAMVWPELCVTPTLRGQIKHLLVTSDLRDSRERPAIVVAGSWHENHLGAHVNRLYVFDGYGAEIITHDKTAPYYDPSWGRENIVTGKTLSLLVTEEAVVGFAICLDFCDVEKNPFSELDVDLILVASAGNDETMRSHQTMAKIVSVFFGTRTFVVQTTTDTDCKDGRIGSILPLLRRPHSVSQEELGQKEVWKSYICPQAN